MAGKLPLMMPGDITSWSKCLSVELEVSGTDLATASMSYFLES